jgi:hypothetical protein
LCAFPEFLEEVAIWKSDGYFNLTLPVWLLIGLQKQREYGGFLGLGRVQQDTTVWHFQIEHIM